MYVAYSHSQNHSQSAVHVGVRRALPTTVQVSVLYVVYSLAVHDDVQRALSTTVHIAITRVCTLDNFSRRCTLSPLTAVHVAVLRVLELLQLLTLVTVMHPLMTSCTLYRSG